MSSLSVEQIQFTAAFQDWANERVLRTAEEAAPALTGAVIPGSFGDGSVHGILAHVIGAEIHWLNRWLGNPRSALSGANEWPTVRDVAEAWRADAPRRAGFYAALTEEQLTAEVSFYRINPPIPDSLLLWKTILHVFNHSTHHRAEVCDALTALGHAPASVDMVEFIRS